MAYTTIEAVKRYGGVSNDDDDALIQSFVDGAQLAIDNYCNRTFEASADSTKYYDAIGEHIRGAVLYLDDEIASITTVTNGDGIAVASDEYTFMPRNQAPYTAIRLLGDSGKVWTYSTNWEDAISITGRWAYSTSAPNDIVQACTELTYFAYRRKDLPFLDIAAIEAQSIRPQGWPDGVIPVLKSRKRYA